MHRICLVYASVWIVYYFLSGFMEWMDCVCENGEISCCEISPLCIISCVVFLCCGSPSICNWMDNLRVMGLAIACTERLYNWG